MTTAAALANNIQDIEIDLLLEGVYRAHGFDFREYSRASIKRRVLELIPQERSVADILMHFARLPPKSLEALMLAVIERPEWARELIAALGESQPEEESG